MDTGRILRHLLVTGGQLRRAFPASTLQAIERAIKASETSHDGEIRFCVEAALDIGPLIRGQGARERAVELFAQLRVWDTEHNNGLLIYLLLADRAVEIVADRGINARVGADARGSICARMQADFGQSNFETGVLAGVQAVTEHLARHFPAQGPNPNELPDQAVVL